MCLIRLIGIVLMLITLPLWLGVFSPQLRSPGLIAWAVGMLTLSLVFLCAGRQSRQRLARPNCGICGNLIHSRICTVTTPKGERRIACAYCTGRIHRSVSKQSVDIFLRENTRP